MVTYEEFAAFKAENAAQHLELSEKIARLTTEVAVLSERINERTQALSDRIDERTQALSDRINERTQALSDCINERTQALTDRINERTDGLSERISALQRTQDLTNRLMLAILGTMGATFAGVMYAALSR